MKKFWAILIAVAFIAMASMPVMAASTEERIAAVEKQLAATWKFYGSVRMATFYNDFKAKDNHKNNGGTGINDKGTQWRLQTNARIGARVTIGNISGHFEYGHGGGTNNDPTTRLLYGKWDFGPGSIVIGKDYSLLDYTVTTQVFHNDNNMNGFGQFDGGREAQIKLIYGAFQFAMINPVTGLPGSGTPTDTTVYLPRFEASYDFNFSDLRGRVLAGFKTYDIVANKGLATEDKEGATSYILAFAMKYVPGPFYAGLTGLYAQNLGGLVDGNMNTGRATGHGVANGIPTAAGPSGPGFGSGQKYIATGIAEDSKTWGVAASIGYKFSDMISLEIGYGHQEDKWSGSVDRKDIAEACYINMPITVAKNFWIIPEFGIENFKTKSNGNTTKLGKSTYIGAKWQVNF